MCFVIDTEFIDCADATGSGTGPAATSWDYQVSYSLYSMVILFSAHFYLVCNTPIDRVR